MLSAVNLFPFFKHLSKLGPSLPIHPIHSCRTKHPLFPSRSRARRPKMLTNGPPSSLSYTELELVALKELSNPLSYLKSEKREREGGGSVLRVSHFVFTEYPTSGPTVLMWPFLGSPDLNNIKLVPIHWAVPWVPHPPPQPAS